MKNQEIILKRALELLGKDLVIIGGAFLIDTKKEEWSGNRYHFLQDFEDIAGFEGYDYESSVDYVRITLIGNQEESEKKMILIKDLL